MKRSALPFAVILAAAALVGLLVYGVAQKAPDHTIDAAVAKGRPIQAPSRDLPLLGASGNGAVSDYRGKVVVLNFWASNCPPCRAEAKDLVQTQRLLAAHGGTVLGVNWKDLTSSAEKFAREHDMTYPSLRDVDGKLAQAYGTHYLPETFVIDRRGRIRAVSRGQVDRAWLEQKLRPLLRQ